MSHTRFSHQEFIPFFGRRDSQQGLSAHLAAWTAGVSLDKSEQTSAWHRRPLSEAQRRYAAADAACLLLLHAGLQAQAPDSIEERELVIKAVETAAVKTAAVHHPGTSHMQRVMSHQQPDGVSGVRGAGGGSGLRGGSTPPRMPRRRRMSPRPQRQWRRQRRWRRQLQRMRT